MVHLESLRVWPRTALTDTDECSPVPPLMKMTVAAQSGHFCFQIIWFIHSYSPSSLAICYLKCKSACVWSIFQEKCWNDSYGSRVGGIYVFNRPYSRDLLAANWPLKYVHWFGRASAPYAADTMGNIVFWNKRKMGPLDKWNYLLCSNQYNV